jgi:hypothetical protein
VKVAEFDPALRDAISIWDLARVCSYFEVSSLAFDASAPSENLSASYCTIRITLCAATMNYTHSPAFRDENFNQRLGLSGATEWKNPFLSRLTLSYCFDYSLSKIFPNYLDDCKQSRELRSDSRSLTIVQKSFDDSEVMASFDPACNCRSAYESSDALA